MSRRASALLLATALATASLGVSIAERRLQEVEIGSGDGLALRFSADGGIVAVRAGRETLPHSGARGGWEVRAAGGMPDLLDNGGFEEGADGVPDGWRVEGADLPGDVSLVDTDARSGERSWKVTLAERGSSPRLVTELGVEPGTEYTVSAWIRTDDVLPTGTPASPNPARVVVIQQGDESLQRAVAYGYTDDSPWTLHEAGLRTGPGVTRITVIAEIRDGSGTAWFDDVRVARLLDEDPAPARGAIEPGARSVRQRSASLHGVRLDTTVSFEADRVEARGVLEGVDGGDHAAQVTFTLPVGLEGWRWEEDPRTALAIEGGDVHGNLSTPTPQGGSDPFGGINQIQQTSVYPFGGVSRGATALGVGVAMSRPRAFRITADDEGLKVTFDLGVSPDAGMGSRADFGFVLYRGEGAWGFRSLAERYYALFPDSFERRTEPDREGGWFVAPPLDSLPGDAHRDFGLGLNMVALGKAPTQSFSEWGTRYVKWGDARGIYTSAYTHQWAFFHPAPRTPPYATVASWLDHSDLGYNGVETAASMRVRREAMAAKRSTSRDVNGRYLHETYREFVSYYQNHDAVDPGDLDWGSAVLREQVGRARELAAEAGGRLDGIHMDSTSGARRWGAVNDFDRGHWANATIPLTFSYANGRVAQLGALSMYRQIERVAEYVRSNGMILSANFNSGPERALGWLGADRIDYFGIEQGLPDKAGGIDRVDPLAMLKRTLAYQRPVTSLDDSIGYGELAPHEIRDRILQSLFYGIHPGVWIREENENGQTKPSWSTAFNRSIFGQRSPVFRRLAAAGWEPVTRARSTNPSVWVERFGDSFLTVRNETDERQVFDLVLEDPFTGRPATDLVTGEPLHERLRIAPRWTMVFRFRPAGTG